ncbi:alanine racemase [Novosphingobium olei]|uniref:alanine racemase n=1 Tax=Novosphingobium olei TaxID=2728851 RepID=A0A7Y0GAC7_9SPHN|nr:alanine racemase [Novosphingobium olei]NML93487.1 alanine racemase [Novosphingobium olei]
METKLPDTCLSLPPASLRLRLDAGALADNWRTLDQMSGAARAGAAVKADAYGLGASRVVPVLAAAGCRDWFVAHWSEVPSLLAHVPAQSIAVLHGPITDEDVLFAQRSGVRPVLNSIAQAARWQAAGGGTCHVMVDTGINRLGIAMRELGHPVLAELDIDLVLSHLASADEDTDQNAAQLARFRQVRAGVKGRRYSLANSAGIALGADYHADLTRPGIALYGGIPRRDFAGTIRQTAYPEVALIQTRDLSAGDLVGYNATFIADRPIRAGTVSIGYADGYLRCWSSIGKFSFNGKTLPVIGRVSMDLVILDLSAVPECAEGDWLSAEYDLPTASAATGLSQYEMLTLLGRRFARL